MQLKKIDNLMESAFQGNALKKLRLNAFPARFSGLSGYLLALLGREFFRTRLTTFKTALASDLSQILANGATFGRFFLGRKPDDLSR
jgi:hypothetical protein